MAVLGKWNDEQNRLIAIAGDDDTYACANRLCLSPLSVTIFGLWCPKCGGREYGPSARRIISERKALEQSK